MDKRGAYEKVSLNNAPWAVMLTGELGKPICDGGRKSKNNAIQTKGCRNENQSIAK